MEVRMKEKIKGILRRDRSRGTLNIYLAGLDTDAQEILTLISEEIEKVEPAGSYGAYSNIYCNGFRECRQKILALLSGSAEGLPNGN